MKKFRTSITKRPMRRKQRNGETVVLDRYILNYADPTTGKRASQFFKTRKEAEAEQHAVYTRLDREGTVSSPKTSPTVAEAVEHWLKHCEGRVSSFTLKSYKQIANHYITGPALDGTKQDRMIYTVTGNAPKDTKLVSMLGPCKISAMTTAQIRSWHQQVLKLATPYVAVNAKKHLATVLAMAAEDFGVRAPAMPRGAKSGYQKKERLLLRRDQVKILLDAASQDKRCGLYYAFPFLTGVRPSEMLGLLWEDIDFVANVIHIRRNQDMAGGIKPFPKTAAGQRSIPLLPSLREVLLEWQNRCPTRPGYPSRVFPALGFETREPGRQVKAGGPLLLHNYRSRIWRPMLARLGLPPVTPYAARHIVISNLQAEGVEIGVVAKIAGHANPQITLKHYTHQVRDSSGVMDKLNNAYGVV